MNWKHNLIPTTGQKILKNAVKYKTDLDTAIERVYRLYPRYFRRDALRKHYEARSLYDRVLDK